MATELTEDFIAEIPKTDLHVHLDGSLRLATLIELARRHHVELPSYCDEGLYELVFKEKYADLGEYLKGFAYTCGVMQDPESVERVAYELASDAYSEGVRYIEPRFAPQLHVAEASEIPATIEAVEKGLKRAAAEFNSAPDIVEGKEPPYGYGIIVCAMRMFNAYFSRYYRHFAHVHHYAPRSETFAMASLELARAAVEARDRHGAAVVGFDLAGQENGYPARNHFHAYDYAHRHFMSKTVHAGEAYGAESIFEALTELHADRIGHGYYLFDAGHIKNPGIGNPQDYIQRLAEYIAARRITIEICLTSNLQTNPALKSLADHPVREMARSGLSATFCTDNRLVSRTNVSREIGLAVQYIHLSPRQLREYVIFGFKRSFMPCDYLTKRAYVRHIIDYYDTLEERHGIQHDMD